MMHRAKGTQLRIAVLSDLHIDRDVDARSWDLARTAVATALAQQPDHVVIAGDVFDRARAQDADRTTVKRHLARLGLWHRDRLTIVVGNHDVFETPHRSLLGRAGVIGGDPGEAYEAFCAWAGELVDDGDRLAGDADLYPVAKQLGDVCLWAADTTSNSVLTAGNGYWREDDDALLRQSADALGAGRRRVLVMHHPPEEDAEQTAWDIVTRNWRHGFPRSEHRRLRRFLSDAAVDVVLCGHIHEGGEPWSERLPRRGAWSHCLGRTHDLDGNAPVIGLLDVPAKGVPRWSTVDVA